jgi:hypothetical protein
MEGMGQLARGLDDPRARDDELVAGERPNAVPADGGQ